MSEDASPRQGCSRFVKVIFFLSLVFNLLFLLVAAYVYGALVYYSTGGTRPLPPLNMINDEPAPDHPLLNSEQEQLLQSLGVDVEKLPTEITPALEDCLEQAVGAARAAEIKAGSTINAQDIIKAKSCL